MVAELQGPFGCPLMTHHLLAWSMPDVSSQVASKERGSLTIYCTLLSSIRPSQAWREKWDDKYSNSCAWLGLELVSETSISLETSQLIVSRKSSATPSFCFVTLWRDTMHGQQLAAYGNLYRMDILVRGRGQQLSGMRVEGVGSMSWVCIGNIRKRKEEEVSSLWRPLDGRDAWNGCCM